MTKPFTDNIFQVVKLYIEGVQVPFTNISITSGIGGLPTASISVPAQAGLMDIARFYQPKVHVFYTDLINDYDDESEADKLIFSGVIAQVSYGKRKDTGSGMGISFTCVHRYNFMNDMLIDYSGWLNPDPLTVGDNEASVKADTANSIATIIEALAGLQDPSKTIGTEITLDNPGGSTSVLPERYTDYYTRLMGMPGLMMNVWNQMKRSAFNIQNRQGNLYYSESFIKMYKPLTEDGLHFFERLGGHFPIEAMVQADQFRIDPCPDTPGRKDKVVIPPANQLFLASAIQSDMAASNLYSYLQNTGEVTSIYGIFNNFYESFDYEILTLTSPAEVPIRANTVLGEDGLEFQQAAALTNKTYALDTIIKPKLPFYFAPTCNVLFPGMYSAVNVIYDEINVPTRVQLKNLESPDQNGYRSNFRGPPSIREAIAKKIAGVNGGAGVLAGRAYSLLATTGTSYGAIGLYEQGRGIKQQSDHLPRWLSIFSQSTLGGTQDIKDVAPDQKTDPARYEAMRQLSVGWARRYPGDQRKTLNPFDAASTDISAHHRMLFAATDYYYSRRFASSKAGTVECPFNPHIVPGYPMDILEANPVYPSFHALCTQVTHTFTESSCSTHVQFEGAMTYAELANYYVPPMAPMLQVALALAENPTLVNPDAKALKTADEFYRYTLGTGSVSPDQIMDFTTMLVKPKIYTANGWAEGSGDSLKDTTNGGERNPMLTYQGNMSLTYRDIESRSDVEDRFGIDFIDMSPANYGSTVMKYRDKNLDDTTKFELGRSQFLDYSTYFGEQIQTQDTTVQVLGSRDPAGTVTETTDTTTNTTSSRRGQ